MKIVITNPQLSEGIIIVDVILRDTYGSRVEVPIKKDVIELEFSDGVYKVIDIGSTTKTPTVNNNVAALEFDSENKNLKVLDSEDEEVMSVSTSETTVLARVNLSTSTITIYQ
ncbi:MAG: hypothetical protein OHK0019_01110 [Saprospiraceae bacterium]